MAIIHDYDFSLDACCLCAIHQMVEMRFPLLFRLQPAVHEHYLVAVSFIEHAVVLFSLQSRILKLSFVLMHHSGSGFVV